VERVIDGDTLVVTGGRTVRLLGVDAPETVNPNMAAGQALGDAAAARLGELVTGREVLLERDVSEIDHYGRLLRHVWVGRALAGEVLVREGLARAGSVPPDVRHSELLEAAEAEARRSGRGMWGLPRPTPLPIFRDVP
jgi:micrococcal nuclease